ncbi:MAG TPA: AI-2E family transporter [Paracoccaceae bacterium]|nr:AI-2E family transporter [Paracoccaceae bacterium]
MSPQDHRPGDRVVVAFATLGLVVLTAFVLHQAQAVLVPIAFAVVAALLLWTAVNWLGRFPVIGRTPEWLRHVVVLGLFIVALTALFVQLRLNADILVARLPTYQANITALLERFDAQLGLNEQWGGGLSTLLAGQFNLQALARGALGTLGNLGGLVIVILFYTAFLLVEYAGFVNRLHLAFDDRADVDRMLRVARDINTRIGGFLAIKTVINILLGTLSYFALLWLGVDLAGFWAIVIGVLNYVPYLGSVAGVTFPVTMLLAQTGSLAETAVAALVLTVIQIGIGLVVEPRLVGQRVNLSPFMVLVSLASWFALWGLPGAVLAVPMTVILLTVLGAFSATRGVAVLLSHTGRV